MQALSCPAVQPSLRGSVGDIISTISTSLGNSGLRELGAGVWELTQDSH